MNLWQENLAFFQKNAKTLYNKLADFDPSSEPRRAVWDDGKRMLRVQQGNLDVWLGSTMSVEREAEKLFADCDENAGFVILLGAGNIKLLPEIRKHFKAIKSLLIIEPSKVIFKELMSNVSVRKVFASMGDIPVNIVLDEEPDAAGHYYSMFLCQYVDEYAAAVRPLGYCQLFPVYKTQMDKIAMRSSQQKDITVRTNTHFRYSWLVNHWRNLKVIAPDSLILGELMEKLPVIIVSAGPSLKNNMHLLKDIGDRAVVIAVGSAMQILNNHGIIPHLRMALDGGSLQTRLFRGLDTEACPLLYAGNLYYETAEWYKNNSIQFMMYKGTTLHNYAYGKAGLPFTSISSGASVANVAVFLALANRCRTIILMGQDLCFTDNKMHAEGTWMDNNKDILAIREKIPARNIFGEDVFTDSVFVSMKTTMENIARWCQAAHYINATEGGLAIEGFENKRLSLVMQEDLPEAKIDVRQHIKDVMASFNKGYRDIYRQRVGQAVLDVKKQTQGLQKEVRILQRLLDDGVDARSIRRIKKQYDKICADDFNKRLFAHALIEDSLAVNRVMNTDNYSALQKALATYVLEFDRYIGFSLELAREFLDEESKINMVFEL